jgi:hypothetical protein
VVLAEKVQEGKVAALDHEVFRFEMTAPREAGECQFVAELRRAEGQPVQSLREFRVSVPPRPWTLSLWESGRG